LGAWLDCEESTGQRALSPHVLAGIRCGAKSVSLPVEPAAIDHLHGNRVPPECASVEDWKKQAEKLTNLFADPFYDVRQVQNCKT